MSRHEKKHSQSNVWPLAIAFTFKGRAILGLIIVELSYNHPVNSVQQNTIKPLINTPKQLSYECSQAGMSLKDVKQTKETVECNLKVNDFVIELKIQLLDAADNFL